MNEPSNGRDPDIRAVPAPDNTSAPRAEHASWRAALADWRARRGELACAFAFLTRLPPPLAADAPPLGQCVWAFPIAGAAVGLIGALVGSALAALGVPVFVCAFLAIAAMIAVTGALHEDGLSDTADGMGAFTRERALEIMRDSRLGTYGALALIVIVGTKAAALGTLFQSGAFWAPLIVAAAAGRSGCAFMLAALKPARRDGLGASSGRPRGAAVAVAFLIPVVLALILLPITLALKALIIGMIPVVLLTLSAARRLGGQTGDVAGAASLLFETTVLIVLAASFTGNI